VSLGLSSPTKRYKSATLRQLLHAFYIVAAKPFP